MGDRLNTQLSKNEETLLASMIGKRFDGYRCDPFFVTKAVYELGPVDQDLDDDDTDEYDETVERRVFSLASGAWIA